MLLNIDNKGNITLAGQAFPFAGSIAKQRFTAKPAQGVTAQQIPYQFTFDTGAGINVNPAGSWLVLTATGGYTVMLASDFQAQFSAA